MAGFKYLKKNMQRRNLTYFFLKRVEVEPVDRNYIEVDLNSL